jgi:hypothetical protein
MELAYQDIQAFIAQCCSGNSSAQSTFQQRYGLLIYTFPMRIFRLPEDVGGEFYVYAFENSRIFRKLRSYEGRNAIQFETYLSYYVLQDLMLDLQRTTEQVEFVSLEMSLAGDGVVAGETKSGRDVRAGALLTPDRLLDMIDESQEVDQLLEHLPEEKRLLLKLLALDITELTSEDIWLLAQIASRSIHETMTILDEISHTVTAKIMRAEQKRDTLHTTAYWMQKYQRQLRALEEEIDTNFLRGKTAELSKLTQAKQELERKLDWRRQQQARVRKELWKADTRPSYKDLARLFNVSLGTMCSKVARVREEFKQYLAPQTTDAIAFIFIIVTDRLTGFGFNFLADFNHLIII